MRLFQFVLSGVVVAVLMGGCDGSDSGAVQFDSVVSFGDSLSDAGTYEVGTIEELDGGQFTINGPSPRVWTEFLSEALNTPAQCAARTGLFPNNGATGAPITDLPDCDNYAQGSSRVTSSGTGPSGVALQDLGQVNLGFLADSLREQMERHLDKMDGAYTGQELVTVNAGANDLFVQLQAVVFAGDGGLNAVGGAVLAGWPEDVVRIVGAGGEEATVAATAAAVDAMDRVGSELAEYIELLVVGNGARYVLVRNLANLNVTPFGLSFDEGIQDLVAAMADAFNGALETGIAGLEEVLLFDDFTESNAIAADPSAFGFTNVTTPACGTNDFSDPPDAPTGPSIVCNETNVIDADTSEFAFADDVHPTPYAHQKTADAVLERMMSAGWQ